MADNTKIEWATATWNPLGGCTRVSEECRNCYAEVMAARFSDPGQWGHGLALRVKLRDGTTDHRWTGKLVLHEHKLDQPLRWKKPRRIFVNSTSDLFHENVPDEWIDRVFAVMALAPQHVFMVLTKRADRMREYVSRTDDAWHGNADLFADRFNAAMDWNHAWINDIDEMPWPLPNVWLGVSVGDQTAADERIPELLATPAAVPFVSAEPLLGPVDLGQWLDGLDWVIVGGESGPGARPMHPDWARSLRDQCVAAGVSFFFKQWGAWGTVGLRPSGTPGQYAIASAEPRSDFWTQTVHQVDQYPRMFDLLGGASVLERIGKKAAGRLLDRREWNEVPG